MSQPWRRWRQILLVLLVTGQVGCTARGGLGLPAPGHLPELLSTGRVDVVPGTGRVTVSRGGFVETWGQETGRCTRDMVVPVALSTYGVGLVFLPAVCGIMTAALPGMTTRFSGWHVRRQAQGPVASLDLHAKLRDAVALAARQSPSSAQSLSDPTSETPEPTVEAPGLARPDAILEVTLTGLAIRDDATLASLSARARLLRAPDRSELASRAFTQQAATREYWSRAVEPTLAALSVVIVNDLLPAYASSSRSP